VIKKTRSAKADIPKKKRGEPEYELQCECVEWFNQNRQDWIMFSVPNESTYKRKEKFKKSGMLSGAPDLVIIKPNETFFIELKSSAGRCSAEQKALHIKIDSLNQKVYTVRTLQNFIHLCTI